MVEEERLADALNAEARDVISPDFKAVNMGQKRATDMKNNRDVKMPGPAPPPIVEAGHNTRATMWQEIFMKHRMRLCDKNGKQRKRNLTTG